MTTRRFCWAVVLVLAAICSFGLMSIKPVTERPVPAWVMINDGVLPLEQTAAKHLQAPVEYSCNQEPLARVVSDLNQFAPFWLNERKLADVGLDGSEKVSIQNAKTVSDAINQLGLAVRIGDNSLEVTTVDDAQERMQDWVYDVTELVTFHDRSPDRFLDVGSLQQVIETVVSPDTWPVSTYHPFDHQIKNGRVFITIPQQSSIQPQIHKLLNVMIIVCEGKRQRLAVDQPHQKIGSQAEAKSWSVFSTTDQGETYQVRIYDVSRLVALTDSETELVQELSAAPGTRYVSVTPFGLGDRRVLIVDGPKGFQESVRVRLKAEF